MATGIESDSTHHFKPSLSPMKQPLQAPTSAMEGAQSPASASIVDAANMLLPSGPPTPPLSDPISSETSSPSEATMKRGFGLPQHAISIPGGEQGWRAVGSPPRKLSISAFPGATSPLLTANSTSAIPSAGNRSLPDEDLLPTHRHFRNRALSTPNPFLQIPANSSGSKWGNLSAQWSGNNSAGTSPLWADTGLTLRTAPIQSLNASPIPIEEFYNTGGALSAGGLMPHRQNRSYSFSVESPDDDFFHRHRIDYEPLKGGQDEYEDDESGYVPFGKTRSRSKSSSAIFGLSSAISPIPSPGTLNSDNIWSMNNGNHTSNSARHSPAEHTRDLPYLQQQQRRGSAQPRLGELWNSREEEPSTFEPMNRTRRGSLSQANNLPEDFDTKRRHTLASTAVRKTLTEEMESMSLTEQPSLEQIDDYFKNTEHRTKAWVEAGKNLRMHTVSEPWPVLVVEFKAGRRDFFYVADPNIVVNTGDFVIVEADRGKDLGKVVYDNIQNMDELQRYRNENPDRLMEAQPGASPKEVQPKQLYRHATPAEVALLVSKSQDEIQAVSVCQQKTRQRNLPMEVVDAEYQWDRKKLTLYFVADRRIDFRELVRELFKLYKTRIWMCAVNPSDD